MSASATPQRRRADKHHIAEWIVWAVRVALLGMASFILWQVQYMQAIHENVAAMKVTIDSHSHQIEEIWQTFRRKQQ